MSSLRWASGYFLRLDPWADPKGRMQVCGAAQVLTTTTHCYQYTLPRLGQRICLSGHRSLSLLRSAPVKGGSWYKFSQSLPFSKLAACLSCCAEIT